MCMHPPTLPPPPPIQWLHCKSWTVFVSHCAQALCSGQLDLLVPGRDALLGCSRLDFHFGSRITEGTYWFPCLCHSYRVWMERFMRSGQLVMHYSHYINYSQWLYRESPIKWTVSNRQVNSLASWLTGPVHIAQSQFHFFGRNFDMFPIFMFGCCVVLSSRLCMIVNWLASALFVALVVQLVPFVLPSFVIIDFDFHSMIIVVVVRLSPFTPVTWMNTREQKYCFILSSAASCVRLASSGVFRFVRFQFSVKLFFNRFQ